MYFTDDSNLTALADVIREKTETTELMYPREMADKIRSIEITSTEKHIQKKEYLEGVTHLTNSEITTFGDSFFGDDTLESIDLPNVTAFIHSDAFVNCTNLKSVNLPKLRKLDGQFKLCHNLEILKLPSLTSMTATADDWYCGVKVLDLGPDFTAVPDATDYDYFNQLYNLEALIFRSPTVVHINPYPYSSGTSKIFFNNYSPMIKGGGYIYVPKDLIEAYSASTHAFTKCTSILRAIEDYPEICGE